MNNIRSNTEQLRLISHFTLTHTNVFIAGGLNIKGNVGDRMDMRCVTQCWMFVGMWVLRYTESTHTHTLAVEFCRCLTLQRVRVYESAQIK